MLDATTALRPWRDGDAEAIAVACQDPVIARWTPIPTPYRITDARAFLLGRYDAVHADVGAPFAIVSPASGTLLGSVALNRLELAAGRGEVGYWLARGARGQGHATRAVRLISRWGFASLGLGRVHLVTAVANVASQRVAQRAGFTREALLRSYMRGRAGRDDMISFSLLRDDPTL